VRSRAELSIDARGRLARVVSAPPVTFRAAGDAVYLVGTAAGPLGEDDISVTVDVAAGGVLRLRSAAATIVYSGRGSRQTFMVTVGRGATLDWHPEPVIATAGCHHVQVARIDLDEGAELDWTEEVVLGRHGEAPGAIDLRLDVDRAGVPLLRHQVVVGAPGWDGPAVLGGHRSTGLRLRSGPNCPTPAVTVGEGWAWMALDAPGWLLVAVADDLPQLRARMAAATEHSPVTA
jgi:urease accessory protein